MHSPKVSVETVRAARNILAKKNFADFCRIVQIPGHVEDDDDTMVLPTAFEKPLAAHHQLLADKLQAVEEGSIQRLMIFMPPGSAKSTYGSLLFPAWFMGRRKGRNVICATYNSDFAMKIGGRARKVIDQPAYRDVFRTELSSDTAAKDNFALTNGNEYMAGGVRSGITGNRADLVIVDDPIKGREDADSDAVRDKTWAEWNDSIKTRAKPGCRFVIIQTRWHEDDLAGRLLPEGYAGESGSIRCRDGMVWEIINIPAEAYRDDDPLGREAGQMLWPEWFTEAHWNQYRGQSRTWNALYQQRPAGEEGLEFKPEWFNGGQSGGIEYAKTFYQPGQQPKALNIYMTSDHARRESARSDYNVFRIWGVDAEGHIWLLDSVRRKGDLLDAMGVTMALGTPQIADTPTNRGALALLKRWRPAKWFPESDPSWQVSDRAIRSYMRDFGLWTRIDEKSTRVKGAIGKVEKARPYIEMCSQSKVHLPENQIGYDTLDEYIPFPAGVHDDQVDADAMMGRVIGEYQKALQPAQKQSTGMDGYKHRSRPDAYSQRGLF